MLSFNAILPVGIVVRERRSDVNEAFMPQMDRDAISEASEARRREYLAVRWCAHAALEALGVQIRAIPSGVDGEPIWPPNIVGSMTHCDGYRAAAVARSVHVRAIGIDAELHATLPPGVEDIVASAQEQEDLHRLCLSYPSVAWDRLLFSAKESVYKAYFPLTRQWLDFADVRIRIDPMTGTFHASVDETPGLQRARLPVCMKGTWAAGSHLITAVVIGR